VAERPASGAGCVECTTAAGRVRTSAEAAYGAAEQGGTTAGLRRKRSGQAHDHHQDLDALACGKLPCHKQESCDGRVIPPFGVRQCHDC